MNEKQVFVSPTDLIESVLESENWDLGSLELKQHGLDRCPNAVAWMTQPKFGMFSPWPRQIQFATKLFEDFCPDCSVMSIVDDMWGCSLEEINRNVVFLQHGVCPNCGKNRNHFKAEQKHFGRNELVGIAGQRCLDPCTRVLTPQGDLSLLSIREGDILLDVGYTQTSVKKCWFSEQSGYFTIVIKLWGETSKQLELACSHEHAWILPTGEVVPTTELKAGQLLSVVSSVFKCAEIIHIAKHRLPVVMIDIETESGTFLHESGLVLHNSGKTFFTGVCSNYITHRYLSLDGQCSAHYDLRNTLLHATFVAGDKSQVAETSWGAFVSELKVSQWYKQYFDYLKTESKRLGVELHKFDPDSYLWFANKQLLLTFRAGSKVGLRGRTRFIGSIDEFGWMSSSRSAIIRSGPDIYDALSNSLETIRNNVEARWADGKFDLPTAYMLNVSSPRIEDDPIMSLAAKNKYNPKAYIFHYATWDINPMFKRESLKARMESEPLVVMRDFGARPGVGRDVLFPNAEIIEAIIDENAINCIEYEAERHDVVIKDAVYPYIKALLKNAKAPRTHPYCLACDAGESGNNFGMLLCSLEDDKTIVNGGILLKPRPADGGRVATIHFPSVLETILDFKKFFIELELVMFDRWQSTSIVQDLRDKKVDAMRYSLKYADFKTFKQRVLEHKISIPNPEISFKHIMLETLQGNTPIAHLVKQLRTVRDTGRAVVKPLGDSSDGNDDLMRCLVLADWALHFYSRRFTRRANQGGQVLNRDSKGAIVHRNLNNFRETQASSGLQSKDSVEGQFGQLVTYQKRRT